jgi:hypothetical protein
LGHELSRGVFGYFVPREIVIDEETEPRADRKFLHQRGTDPQSSSQQFLAEMVLIPMV